jgi:transposase-like protein
VEREGGEDHVPSSDVNFGAVDKIVRRWVSKDSTVYTDAFTSYHVLDAATTGIRLLTSWQANMSRAKLT